MRFYRFYTSEPLAINSNLELDKVQSNHISRVLRLGVGQEITLFNGNGIDYLATILDVKKSIGVQVIAKQPNKATPELNIHLVQGLARGDRMDYAIQKAVEMGVTKITPLITEYVQIRFDQKRLDKKMRHWQAVIQAALAQSGRADKVHLQPPLSFSEWHKIAHSDCIYLHPRTDYQMPDAIDFLQQTREASIQVAIGPEGGFSDAEMAQVDEQRIIGLGQRILRTETAATAVLAILQHNLGK